MLGDLTGLWVLYQMRERLERQREQAEDARHRREEIRNRTPYEPPKWSLPEHDKNDPAGHRRDIAQLFEANKINFLTNEARETPRPWSPEQLDKVNDHLLPLMCLENTRENRAAYSAFRPDRIEEAAGLLDMSVEEARGLVHEAQQTGLQSTLDHYNAAQVPVYAEGSLKNFDRQLTEAAEYRLQFGGSLEDHRAAILTEMNVPQTFLAEESAGLEQRYYDRLDRLISTSPGCDENSKQVGATFKEIGEIMNYMDMNYDDLAVRVSPEAQENYAHMMGIVFEGSRLPEGAGAQQKIDETQCPYPSSRSPQPIPSYPADRSFAAPQF